METIVTDERWQKHAGAITFSCVYGGEDFDARLAQRGWDTAGFDAGKWITANVVNVPGGELRGLSTAAPPLKTFETFAAKSITPNTEGSAAISKTHGVKLIQRSGDRAILEVGSGSYEFQSVY